MWLISGRSTVPPGIARRDLAEKLDFAERAACAFGDSAQRILGDMNQQTGFLCEEAIKATEQCATASEHETAVYEICRKLRRAPFERHTDGIDNRGDWFEERFTNLLRRDRE